MGERFEQLIDCKGIQDELGVTRAAAEKMMRQLPNVQVEGLRKLYVKRSDLKALLERSTKKETQAA
jgi:UDP-N-acetyl-D-mannosaminuronic acid transferase (WecB/TagA/CpsF family)